MNGRRDIARLIGAVLCAYLVVLQAVAGGIAMAEHAASSADSLSIRCLDMSGSGLDGEAGKDHAPASCCTLGCAPAAFADAYEPVVSVFRYDPRPTPRRALEEREAPRPTEIVGRLKHPRGPPSIG
ncbi:hypothetical protein [Methylopila sp. M107]|uniref:hypothetical protein n=1 Tax=Methylopila sp. M107 TaxID=1101190 RepID=UPI0003825DFA|nr:hypothetical protein [Methylopila sp. M107]